MVPSLLVVKNLLLARNKTIKLIASASNVLIHTTSRDLGSRGSKTCLYDFHIENKAKIVDFTGWQMPVQYKDMSVQESHHHTRTSCSLFDVSHMMQTRIHGEDRFKYIESLVVSDIKALKPDTGTLTVYTTPRGGIIDDLIVANTSNDYLFVVSNAGCAEKDFAHMSKRLDEIKLEKRKQDWDVELERVTDRGLLALQGPKMQHVLQQGVEFDLSLMPFMATREATVFGIEHCRVTRCGYTGEDGVEISVPQTNASQLASILLEFDEVRLAGLGARDTLRLEAGLCLYGNDIDESTTPIEAGLAWLVHKTRRAEANFPGASHILSQLKEKSYKKRRVGLKLLNSSGPSARQHMQVFASSEDGKADDNLIGEITSGCPSPSLKQNIAMAYVKPQYVKPGTQLTVQIRKKKYPAEVVKLPFAPTHYHQVK